MPGLARQWLPSKETVAECLENLKASRFVPKVVELCRVSLSSSFAGDILFQSFIGLKKACVVSNFAAVSMVS